MWTSRRALIKDLAARLVGFYFWLFGVVNLVGLSIAKGLESRELWSRPSSVVFQCGWQAVEFGEPSS